MILMIRPEITFALVSLFFHKNLSRPVGRNPKGDSLNICQSPENKLVKSQIIVTTYNPGFKLIH
jgi:hypothetical protein